MLQSQFEAAGEGIESAIGEKGAGMYGKAERTRVWQAARRAYRTHEKDKRFELCVYGSLVLAGILIYAVTSFPKNSAVEPVSLEEPDSVYSSERETEERLKTCFPAFAARGRSRL